MAVPVKAAVPEGEEAAVVYARAPAGPVSALLVATKYRTNRVFPVLK